jgi:hypothetical protein
MTTTEAFPTITREAPPSTFGAPFPKWIRLLSRMHATSLDRQLASGRRPESDRVLAARAHALVALRSRRQRAEAWRNLLDRAETGSKGASNRAPLNRGRIIGAERELRDLIASLSAPATPTVRGVAMANLLMADGAGPLYNARSDQDLGAAVHAVTVVLRPEA